LLAILWDKKNAFIFYNGCTSSKKYNLSQRNKIIMPRKSPSFEIEERSGNQYPNLEEAQKAALKATAADLVERIRSLLVSGVLIVDKGKIIPNPGKISQTQKDDEEHIGNS
jgi:hypothetical protein